MAKRAEDSFWFPEKLGLRLAELRRQRGLTQGQVAELMGRAGKGSKTCVCRLERGRFRSPSLRLLGDYVPAMCHDSASRLVQHVEDIEAGCTQRWRGTLPIFLSDVKARHDWMVELVENRSSYIAEDADG